MALDFMSAFEAVQPQAAGATGATGATGALGGVQANPAPQDLGALLGSAAFQRASVERRREIARDWSEKNLPRLAHAQGWDAASRVGKQNIATLANVAKKALAPHLQTPSQGALDTDWLDAPAAALARSGANLIDAFSPNHETANALRAQAAEIEAQFGARTQNDLRRRQELINEAKARGDTGVWEAVKDFASHPVLRTGEALGSSALPLAAGAVLGVPAALAAGAALEFGGSREAQFALAQKAPMAVLAQHPEVARLQAAGWSEERIRDEIGRQIGLGNLVAGAGGAIEGAFLGRIPGWQAGSGLVGRGLERLTGGAVASGSRTAGALSGALEEGASGAVSQLGNNLAQRPLDPRIRLGDDLALSAVEEAMPGTVFGALGQRHALPEKTEKAPAATPPATATAGLARAQSEPMLDRLAGDLAAGLMDEVVEVDEVDPAAFDRAFDAWAQAHPQAAQRMASVKERVRERTLEIGARARGLIAAVPELTLPDPGLKDSVAKETVTQEPATNAAAPLAQQAEKAGNEQATDPIEKDTPAVAAGDPGGAAAVEQAAGAQTAAGHDRPARTESHSAGGGAGAARAPARQRGPLAAQPGAGGPATGVRTDDADAAADPAAQQRRDQPAAPAGAAADPGQRGAADRPAAGRGNRRQPRGAGAGAGRLDRSHAILWEHLANLAGHGVPLAALAERDRTLWRDAVDAGEADRGLAVNLAGRAQRAHDAAQKTRQRVPEAGLSKHERAAARDAWDQGYGVDAQHNELPFDALTQDAQDDWAETYRDPKGSEEQRNRKADDLIRIHLSNERRARANDKARANELAASEPVGKLPRKKEATLDDSAQDRVLPEPDAQDVNLQALRLSRPEGDMPAKPLSAAAVRQVVDALEQRLPAGVPKIEIFRTPTEVFGAAADGVQAAGATANGRIYLFSEGIDSPLQVQRVVFHELFHLGLAKLLPPSDYAQTLRGFLRDPRVQAYAARWQASAEGRRRKASLAENDWLALSAEEALAGVAEALNTGDQVGAARGPLVRAVAALAAKLAEKIGMARLATAIRRMTYDETERFVAAMLGGAGQKDPDGPGAAGGPRYAQSPGATRSGPGAATSFDAFANHRAPRGRTERSVVSRLIEQVVNSYTPVSAGLGVDADHPVMRALERISHQADGLKVEAVWRLKDWLGAVAKSARTLGVTAPELQRDVGQYATAMYIAHGANLEHAIKLTDRVAEIDAEEQRIADLHDSAVQKEDHGERLTPEERRYLDEGKLPQRLEAERAAAREWLAGFDDHDLTVFADVASRRASGYAPIGGITTAEARAMVAGTRAKYGENMAQIDALHGQLMDWGRHMTEDFRARGLYSDAQIEGWTDNPYYVPTTGTPDAPEGVGDALGASISNQTMHKRRQGRASIADGADIAWFQRMEHGYTELGAMDFKKELEKLAQVNGSGVHLVPASQVGAGGFQHTVSYRMPVRDPATGQTTTRPMAFTFDDPAVGEAIYRGNMHWANPWSGPLAGATRAAQWVMTQGTLAFPVISTFRDVGEKMGFLATRGLRDAKGAPLDLGTWSMLAAGYGRFLRGAAMRATFAFEMRHAYTDTPEGHALRELMEHGGVSIMTDIVGRTRADLARMVQQQTGWSRLPHATRELFAQWSGAWELQSSLVAYMLLRDRGVARQDAASAVLDAMNFRRQGSATPGLRALFLFLNPAIQGGYNTARMLVSNGRLNPKGVSYLLSATALAAALQALAAATSGGDEDDELLGAKTDRHTTSELQRSLIFYAGDQPVKVPVPYGISGLAWTAALVMRRMAQGKMDALEAAAEMGQVMARELTGLPLSETSMDAPALKLLRTVTPYPLQGLLSAASGTSEFGSALNRPWLSPNQPRALQGKASTPAFWSDIATGAARLGVDMTPEQWRALAGTVLVGPLQEVTQALVDEHYRSNLLFAATGANRVLGKGAKGLEIAFYRRLDDGAKLTRRFNLETDALRPPAAENGRRPPESAQAFEERLAHSSLSERDAQLVLAYRAMDLEKKRGRLDAQQYAELMRRFLEETR